MKTVVCPPLFNLGFRPFFLGAAIFSVLIMVLWFAVYVLHLPAATGALTIYQWHAHEMIYGYTLAVIAGFLLTAVKNWTGIQTLHSLPLAGLFALWVLARILFMAGGSVICIAAFFDLAFVLGLCVAVSLPIVRAKNWRQLGILSKLLLLGAGNACFYTGAMGWLPQGVYWGIYGGLYLIVSLILLMGGRVVPFFIERGVGYPVVLSNPRWLALASLALFVVFFVDEVFLHYKTVSAYAAAGLVIVNGLRLYGWHTAGIWRKPLLWGLYLPFIFIVAGFLLHALGVFAGVPGFLAVHAFAYGGIGLVTMAMMGRVAVGHTGRDINHPPTLLRYALLILIAGTVIRVFLPLADMGNYPLWIALSQVLWAGAFLLFVIAYAPILTRPRVDGQFG